MKERAVIMKEYGLPEYEGQVHWVGWGSGVGDTLIEVCQDIIRKNPKKGAYFRVHGDGTCSAWGMPLFLVPKEWE